MMIIVYIDDTIITGPDATAFDTIIKDLGVSSKNEDTETFMLCDKGDFGLQVN